LSEPNGPVILPAGTVPGTAHPQGIAVVAGFGTLPDHGHKHNEATTLLDTVFSSEGSSGVNLNGIEGAIARELLKGLNHQSAE